MFAPSVNAGLVRLSAAETTTASIRKPSSNPAVSQFPPQNLQLPPYFSTDFTNFRLQQVPFGGSLTGSEQEQDTGGHEWRSTGDSSSAVSEAAQPLPH